MANSDWSREAAKAPQESEHRWAYFTPVIGQVIEEGWEFTENVNRSFVVCSISVGDDITLHDLQYLWRRPNISKVEE